jgi:AcrR family transcriptional regulator
MNGHQKRAERIREKILRSASDLILRFGIRQVSVSRIADAAGVSRVTVFKYFSSKDALIHHCIRRHFANLTTEIERILNSDDSYRQRLYELMETKNDSTRVFSNSMDEWLRTESPELVEEILATRRAAIRDSMIPFLEEGQRDGYFRDDVSIDALLTYLDVVGVGVAHSPVYADFSDRRPEEFKEVQKISVSALLRNPDE